MRLFSQLKIRQTTVIVVGLIAFLVGLGLARFKISIGAWSIWLSSLAGSSFANLHAGHGGTYGQSATCYGIAIT